MEELTAFISLIITADYLKENYTTNIVIWNSACGLTTELVEIGSQSLKFG